MNDELFEKLAGLTTHDIDGWRKQRTRKRAHKVLLRRRRHDSIGRTWSRYLEPVLVTGLSMVYLAWALQRVYFLVV
jgi:hypothetical protein